MRVFLILLLPSIIGGCAILRPSPNLPTANTIQRDQLVIHSDFPLASRHRLVEDLAQLRADVTTRLNLPTSQQPISVFLFESKEKYTQFTRESFPEFPARRAFFVKDNGQLSVYAHWGERTAEDLRHEVTHGYLHAAAPKIPLWLDEGLAEYFEVARDLRGVNRVHVDLLIRKVDDDAWVPDLARLERLTSSSDMTLADYAEAWLWTHFLLETSPARHELLQQHIATIRYEGHASSLARALYADQPDVGRQLVRHLKSLTGKEVMR